MESDAATKSSKSAKLAAMGALLRDIGDETDKRKFPDLVAEWRDEVDDNYREDENLYCRLMRQVAEYITSWNFLENVYVPRTDNFLNSSN